MAVDQSIIDQVNQHLLEGSSHGFLRREARADEVAGQALEDVRNTASNSRASFNVIEKLVLNRIISDQTGEDDVASERILTGREVQSQPQENTYDDPNYRPGASPPTAPPVAPKAS